MFENFQPTGKDPIIALMDLYRSDTRADKIDVGIGVFKDTDGQTPIMRAVRVAEKRLHEMQSTKAYVGMAGDLDFGEKISELVFDDSVDMSRVRAVQAPGGSGALRVCADMLYNAMPEKTLWVSDPTWGNHRPIFEAAGFTVKTYSYLDKSTKMVDEEKMLEAISKFGKDDIVLLHGCCHNPTGSDITQAGWDKVAELAAQNGFLPFVDLAYQGFGKGLDVDLYGTRKLASTVNEMVVTSSCSKNFGLYRDRVGCAMILAKDSETADITKANLVKTVRVAYSMPPDHGAAIVGIILKDQELVDMWQDELAQMRERILGLRAKLSARMREITGTNDWDFIEEHCGMFSLLCLEKEQTDALVNEHSIYIVNGGRINIAGLQNDEQLERFAQCLALVTKK